MALRVDGEIIGRWGDDGVLIRLSGGRSVSVPVPPALTEIAEVGAEVHVWLDDEGEVLGWLLTAHDVGVDTRSADAEAAEGPPPGIGDGTAD